MVRTPKRTVSPFPDNFPVYSPCKVVDIAVMTLQEQIDAKRAEILHYEGCLERYGSGRWLDQGRRHMADLKQELADLLAQQEQQ